MQRKTSIVLDAGLYRVPKPSETLKKHYKKLMIVMSLSITFIIAEFIGGLLSHSISVMSDCLHLVTDLVGFIISFIALKYANKKKTRLNSFGFHRIQIIGVLANLFIIWSLTLAIVIEATERIMEKAVVHDPKIMLIVAGGGLAVNFVMYFILHTGGGHSHLGHSHCKGHTNSEQPQKIEHKHTHNDHQDCHGHSHQHDHNKKENDHISEVQEDQQQEKVDTPNTESADNFQLKEPLLNTSEIQTSDVIDIATQKQNKATTEKKIKKKAIKKDRKHSNQHPHDHSHGHTHTHNKQDPSHDHHKKQKQQQNMSMKAAILHALTDIIQSIGLLIASILIFFFGSDHGAYVEEYNHWHLLDPLSTYLFSILVIVSTFPITKQCYYIILEATPLDFDQKNLHSKFSQTQGVIEVHDFHVWSLKPGSLLLSAHVYVEQGTEPKVLQRLTTVCREHKIYHSTIQIQGINKTNYKSSIICQNDIHQ